MEHTRATGRARGRAGPLLAMLVATGACRSSRTTAPESGVDDPFDDQPYAQGPLPAATKVLLVAGGDDVANFAAEVVEQRALWLEAGLGSDEIACYYAKPTLDALIEDGEQWRELAPMLRDCYPADPATVHGHLRQVAQQAPPFVYVFVSSHGLPPIMRWAAGVDDPNLLPRHFELQRGEIGRFDRHAIGLEAGDGPGLGEVQALLEAHRAGAEVEALMLSPDTLAGALGELPEGSAKIVVLQACFSGGFIEREDEGWSPLTKVPRVTVLTATSADRPSFGCGAGSERTYYGGAFNRVLAEELEREERRPTELPWEEMHERVRFVVETMEIIDGEAPSRPRYFSNVPGRESEGEGKSKGKGKGKSKSARASVRGTGGSRRVSRWNGVG
ncbi:MAG: hypothetical protein KDK70_12390 [Myxococcales bacterium]|nr:hypothetical protein [Myxococcales bacterium]